MSQEENKTENIVDKMLPDKNIIQLSNGLTLEVKPLSWGKEIKVCKLVSGFIGDSEILTAINTISSIKEGDEDSAESLASLSKILLPAINEAPDKITQIVSIITEKEVKFVEESLTSEDVMKIFIPFLRKLFTKYMTMFNQGTKQN
jgi:hypothetical protein